MKNPKFIESLVNLLKKDFHGKSKQKSDEDSVVSDIDEDNRNKYVDK